MRKATFFFLLVATMFSGACTKPDNTTPAALTVSVTPTTASANPGDSLNFVVSISDGTTLSNYQANVSVNGAASTQLISTTLSGTSASITQGYRVPTGVTGPIVITFLVTDASGANANATATITVTSTISSFSQILLGNYNDPNVGSFYASSVNSVFNVAATTNNPSNQALVDMVFYYGATNQATLAAPSDNSFGTGPNRISSLGIQNWSIKNNTMFKTTTLTSLSGINSSTEIAAAYTNSTATPATLASMLATGNVIGFTTVLGKIGLVQVESISMQNASTGMGEMQINVIVQK